MRIELAYPYEDHQPDETIEVDDAVGQTLIADGRARPVPETKRSTRNARQSESEE